MSKRRGADAKGPGLWDTAVNLIIRPERAQYDVGDLGPASTVRGGMRVNRHDLELLNDRGDTLQCSWYKHASEEGALRPVVVYLHGNCGCRLDARVCLQALLPFGVSVFTFDFAGSGMSGGQYVSLGAHEKSDLATVVRHLRESGEVSTIGLWGRSMGAVTAILYATEDPSIAAMVLDSPFSNLSLLAEELVENHEVRVPKALVKVGLVAVRKSIQKRAHFDINLLRPVDLAPSTFIPALFVHGEDDDFVRPHHSQAIFDVYAGDKNRILVAGGHNSARPSFLRDSVAIFFSQTMQLERLSSPDVHEDEQGDVQFGGALNAHSQLIVLDDQVDEEQEMIRRAIELSLQEQ